MPPENSRKKLKFFLSFLLIFFCVSAAYLNSLKAPFIWDDEALVLKNPLIRSAGRLNEIFTGDLYSGVEVGSNFYRPAQTLSYLWDYHFWQLDPLGYHLTNILLQGLVSCLVLSFAYFLTGSLAVSSSAALLFALCPLHTQAVTYISGRAEMLMGLFLLSSWLLFFKSVDDAAKHAKVFYILSLFLFAIALLSKELAVFFPLAVLAYLLYFSKKKFLALPYFALSGGYIFLRVAILNFSTLRPPSLSQFPLFVRITMLPKVLLTYLRLLLLPVDLHMSRELLRPTTFSGFCLAWLGMGALAVVCFLVIRNRAKKKAAPFLLCWFLIFFLPQSGIFPINAFISEHFIYLSSISFFIGAAALLHRCLRKQAFLLSVIFLLMYYGALTVSRNYEWQDPEIFYKRIIERSPGSFQAHNNLGMYYGEIGRYEMAVREYKRALELMPGMLETYSNLANVYYNMGRYQDSLEHYFLVERMAPPQKAGEVQNNMGAVFEAKGLHEEAIRRYELALKLDPSLHFAYFNMARIDLLKGDIRGASLNILRSLSLPDQEAWSSEAYLKLIEEQSPSLKITRCAPSFYNNLGIRFAEKGHFDAAIACFRLALEVNPGSSDTHFNIGLAYWKKGENRRAAREFNQALKLDPRHHQARGMLHLLKRSGFSLRK